MRRPLFSLSSLTLVLLTNAGISLLPTSLGQQAIAVPVSTTQNRRNEAIRLNQIGLQQLNQGQFREALETFERALTITTEIGAQAQSGTTLNNIGAVYRSLGQYAKALESYNQALAIRKQIGDQAGYGTTLNNIGLVYKSLAQYVEALEFFNQALAISKEVGDQLGYGTTLHNIGEVYRNLGQYAKALEFFNQALAISKEVGDQAGYGTTLNSIGAVYTSLGQYAKALEFFNQALAISKEVGDQAGYGTTLNNIGAVYTSLGQYAKALEFYNQALVISKEIGDQAGYGMTLHNIGEVYRNLGQYAKALEFYNQALAIAKEIGDQAGYGMTLNNIGLVYTSLGQYAKALEFFNQALAISKEVGDQAGYGTTLNSIGAVYRNLGQYAKALEFFNQALTISKEVGDQAGYGTTLHNIGLVYNNLGQYAKALEIYTRALAIRKEIGARAGYGTTLNNIGLVYDSLGQYAKALEFFNQALAISKEVGDQAQYGTTLNNIGLVYYKLRQYAKALEFFSQALAIIKEIGAQAQYGMTLNNIGAAYDNLGQFAEAETNFLAALEVMESLRPDLTDAQKISIFETQQGTYELLQQVLVAQNKINSALEVSERGRARAFVELLSQKLSDNPNNLPTIKPTLAQIQQIAKAQNATLVQYSIVREEFKIGDKQEWRESELYIWVVNPAGEVTFRKADLKPLWQQQNTNLAELVTVTRQSIGVRGLGIISVEPGSEAIQQQQINQTQSLQKLHQLLIAPIADLLPADSNSPVVFIPQQALFLVPFAALQDEKGTYLIDKHTILTAPSIQVLELTHKQRQAVSGKEMLIVGNPTMPSISPQVGEEPVQLSELPGAEAEAQEIAKLFKTQPLIGSQATETAIKKQISGAKIVHLATHGLIDNFGFDVPGAVALAPDGKEDGLLTSGEILDLKINAELVVLSACDTGRGEITGDGVIGLSRSLITAGTPTVIVSLWAVPDAPTADLMSQFYRNLQQEPSKAQALRQAMLATKQQHPNPRDWAAFTVIGEAQ